MQGGTAHGKDREYQAVALELIQMAQVVAGRTDYDTSAAASATSLAASTILPATSSSSLNAKWLRTPPARWSTSQCAIALTDAAWC
jgi:hypothetical protein